jgi:hypothetical protein
LRNFNGLNISLNKLDAFILLFALNNCEKSNYINFFIFNLYKLKDFNKFYGLLLIKKNYTLLTSNLTGLKNKINLQITNEVISKVSHIKIGSFSNNILNANKNYFNTLGAIKLNKGAQMPITYNKDLNYKYIKDTSAALFLIRDTHIYNKGQYSRNRQTYRTGVFWCLALSIISVVTLYYLFFGVFIKFGYIFSILFLFVLLYFISFFLNYR